jgi:hypothetical protein
MAFELVFETHSMTVDNEQGRAHRLAARPALVARPPAGAAASRARARPPPAVPGRHRGQAAPTGAGLPLRFAVTISGRPLQELKSPFGCPPGQPEAQVGHGTGGQWYQVLTSR